ncbi:MAG TPA: PhzF family phenazine biosynthesis protein [Vicinamibacteria bacterium]|nr:PhzF family phenazine biosynthesis protein [Vicinamibacteria bacterium]
MELRLFQVDAFASRVFAGNPAAVVPLDRWLDDATLQGIAAENNLSETAFLVGGNGDYHIRWMTPTSEVDLCGHATLASAWVVFNEVEKGRTEVRFRSKSGPLRVSASGSRLALDFPSRPPAPADDSLPALAEALGSRPQAALASRDALAVFASEDEVRSLRPDMAKVAALDCLGLIATAPGRDSDFVSRFFAPAVGIPEDPVTGSAHCTLVPYWAKRLGRTSLFARQVSSRGGELWCEDQGARVTIAGHCAKYLAGSIDVADGRG